MACRSIERTNTLAPWAIDRKKALNVPYVNCLILNNLTLSMGSAILDSMRKRAVNKMPPLIKDIQVSGLPQPRGEVPYGSIANMRPTRIRVSDADNMAVPTQSILALENPVGNLYTLLNAQTILTRPMGTL